MKLDISTTFGIIVIFILFIILIVCMMCSYYEYQDWYNSLSENEMKEYELQKQQEYESRIETYEVLSVHKYIRTETNNMGGIIDTDVCYTFTYISNGSLKEVTGFEHLEYGLTKVSVGDSNMYIINNNGESTRTLQLTKETLENIQPIN